MPQSKCPSCDSHQFEAKAGDKIRGTVFTHMFVQCAKCGAVVGVLDFFNLGTLIRQLAKALKIDLDKVKLP